ncbi:hypothetical protein HDE_12741 [Halotydeus destructor]|nr:hypothetical protein HDE_12741 [Halotydeus destructor]
MIFFILLHLLYLKKSFCSWPVKKTGATATSGSKQRRQRRVSAVSSRRGAGRASRSLRHRGIQDSSIAPDEESSDSSQEDDSIDVFSEEETEPEMPSRDRGEESGRKVSRAPKRVVGPRSAVGPKKVLQVEAVEDQDENWSLDPFKEDEIQPSLENDSEWVRESERRALTKLRDSVMRGNDRLQEMAVEVSILLTRMKRESLVALLLSA